LTASPSPLPRLLLSATTLLLPALACALPATPQDPFGHELLFSGGAGSLTRSDQEEIYGLLALELHRDSEGLLQVAELPCPWGTTIQVRFQDLDRDGGDEVFVEVENGCLYGNTGVATTLFIRDQEGRFQSHLGFPGFVDVLEGSVHLGFPDLLIGGPGFCFPVWRWDGERYELHRREAQVPGGCP
jgi:hypothetical protein